MTRPVAFVDLDDTLFQTRRKCPAATHERLRTLAVDRDGGPLSFATPRQALMLDWLLATARVIPVTARSREALGRVRLPAGVAVCAHGGVILDGEGTPEPAWTAAMAAAAKVHASDLADLAHYAGQRAADLDLTARVVVEDEIALYLLLKPIRHEALEGLDALTSDLGARLPSGWTLHRNDANAALLPPFLGKGFAVAHLLAGLRAEQPDVPTLGFGDSFTDAPFMALCDVALTPTGSQLASRLLGSRS